MRQIVIYNGERLLVETDSIPVAMAEVRMALRALLTHGLEVEGHVRVNISLDIGDEDVRPGTE